MIFFQRGKSSKAQRLYGTYKRHISFLHYFGHSLKRREIGYYFIGLLWVFNEIIHAKLFRQNKHKIDTQYILLLVLGKHTADRNSANMY